MNLKLKICLY